MRQAEALLAARRAASTSDSVALRIIDVSPTRSNKAGKSTAENGTVRLNILMTACSHVFGKMDERGETCSPRTEKALAAAPPPPEPPPAP